MRSSAHTAGPLALGVVSAALVAVALLCLGATSLLDRPTVALSELAERDSRELMSCAGEDAPSAEPMWCANPDSPHCAPALPSPERSELVHGPVAMLQAPLVAPARPRSVAIMSWPARPADHARSLRLRERLERPPRYV